MSQPGPVDWQGRPVWAEVDLDALAHNVRALRSLAGAAALMAVVKANAYGHGAGPVARAALEAGATYLGVVCVDEGEQLRRAGITAPILVMGHVQAAEAQRIVDLSLTPTVNSLALGQALARCAAQRGATLPIHLKVDTGLARYGSAPREAIALADALRGVPNLWLEGLFTHFALAEDGDREYTAQQYRDFLAVAQQLPWVPLRHACNTAALLQAPEMALELVRPGIGLYGCYPSPQVSQRVALRPILSLRSRIARLHRLAPGQGISYGHTWRAPRPTTVALVMCGYGDGLPRSLSNRGSLLVDGRRVPIVGRIAMDMCLADVTDLPQVAVGDQVTVVGRQGEEEIAVDEIAALDGTISYEVLCRLAARVPRLYLRRGQAVAVETLVQGSRAGAPPSLTFTQQGL